MEFTITERGNSKLIYGGYMYVKHVQKTSNIRWRCTMFNSGCKGTLVTDLNKIHPSPRNEHSHPPDSRTVQVAKCRAAMKTQASATRDTPNVIYNEQVSRLSRESTVVLSAPDTCKRTIRRNRAKDFPDLPSTLADLKIEGAWTMTSGINPVPFLFYDNNSTESRIIAFATDGNMRHIARSESWFMDGNYMMAPPLFSQLYVIHTNLGNTTIPVVYAFLQRKTQSTYEELLRAIVEKCTQLGLDADPATVTIDFEQAVSNALVDVFGCRVNIHYCFYHLTQSTWRKVQELGLVDSYRNEDSRLRHFCGMLDGLAFLPLNRVSEGMEYLKTVAAAEAVELLHYFDSTYVSGSCRSARAPENVLRIRRMPPVFPPPSWNVHNITMQNNHRTNNVCEAWNNKYNRLIGHPHPSVWRSIQAIQGEQGAVEVDIMKHLSGQTLPKRIRRGTTELQKRLVRLCEELNSGTKTLPEFLNSIGHSIRMY